MSESGRLIDAPSDRIRRVLFEADQQSAAYDAVHELVATADVDIAHITMLVEQKILPRAYGAMLVEEIAALNEATFRPVLARPRPRGLYLAYESYLIERLGGDVAGSLHAGRSRNDLRATTTRLMLREPYSQMVREAFRLAFTSMRVSRRYAALPMPAYTHYQPAVPTTLGHYLAGVVSALTRSIAVLVAAADDLDISPLGAGAVGGTTLPIRPERTAELLGFSDISENSIDAVASRDFVLQIIGAASMTGVLASRVAHDLLLWSMQEFAFVHFPDRLSGSSSMMPQKRNPFVLEHVQGKAMATSGSFVAAMTVMAAAPFTNSAAVGTEAVTHVFSAAKNLRDALMLLRLMIADAEPNAEAMVTRGRAGETSATWTAEWLVRTGMPFREAHHLVGTIAREAAERGDEFAAAVVGALHRAGYPEFELPDFSDIPLLMVHGGGAGGDNVFSTLRSSKRKLSPLYATHQTRVRRWEASQDRLENAAATLLL